MSRTAFLRLEWLLSLGLTVLSLAWATARGIPLVASLAPTFGALASGVLAGAVLWGTIPLLLRSPAMRRVWNEVLLPFSRTLATRDVVVIALLSGFSEELFFRGVLMPEVGLVVSSLCFGALHALCATYFIWATVVGAGMGALALATGSLLTPIAAHATYNLGALLLLRRSAAHPPALVPTESAPVMVPRRSYLAALLAGLAASLFSSPGMAEPPPRARNVVLVHGAYADGSCWSAVISRLQEAGLNVTAVQNPLTSLADDVEATRRILALQNGPTVLVGHSWAGTVITEAGGDPKVTALVFVAARAPDIGEDYGALAAKFPPAPASAGLVQVDGFAQLSEEAFLRDFAGDLDPAQARVLYAVQGRISATLFASRTTQAAWKSKPTWYAVSTKDRTTAPDLQRFLAKRMNARTIELESGHLSLISHPEEITDLILEAAGARPTALAGAH